jgi:hypothetical protein
MMLKISNPGVGHRPPYGQEFEVPSNLAKFKDLWELPDTQLDELAEYCHQLIEHDGPEVENVVVVALFASIYRTGSNCSDDVVRKFDQWCEREPIRFLVLMDAAAVNPGATAQIIRQRYHLNMKAMGQCLTIAQCLPPIDCCNFVTECALNPEPVRRHYFFEVATNFHRLVVPKSLTPYCSEEVMLEILHQSLQDPVAAVRERAIVYTYGLGWVDQIAPRIIVLTRDESQDVRQYALVALGIATDDASMQILLSALESDSKPEMQSAIWALARRQGGLERLLPMLNDDRSWVIDDVLGAIKWVSLPLTDQQIASVQQLVESTGDREMLPSIIGHHLWRTRDPQGKEFPPDRRITYALSPEPP